MYKLINVHMYNNQCNVIPTTLPLSLSKDKGNLNVVSFTLTLIYKISGILIEG